MVCTKCSQELAAGTQFCSRCGTRLSFGPVSDEERDRLACPACGFVFYVNPRLVVTTLPVTGNGEVMLIRRGIEPGKGRWAQPGRCRSPVAGGF